MLAAIWPSSSLFVSVRAEFAQMGACVCTHVYVADFPWSPTEVCTSLHMVFSLPWPSLEVVRLQQHTCLCGGLLSNSTDQRAQSRCPTCYNTHRSTPTESPTHRMQNKEAHSHKGWSFPSTLHLQPPSPISILLDECRAGEPKRRREERQHWFLLYRLKKLLYWRKQSLNY